jgi:hypothetical protein
MVLCTRRVRYHTNDLIGLSSRQTALGGESLLKSKPKSKTRVFAPMGNREFLCRKSEHNPNYMQLPASLEYLGRKNRQCILTSDHGRVEG